MLQNIDITRIYAFDVIGFFILVLFFILSRYFLRLDIDKKEHKVAPKTVRSEFIFYGLLFVVTFVYISSLFLEIDFLAKILKMSFSLALLYMLSLLINRQILMHYGKVVEVSWETYFKKWYEVNLFSLSINFIAILVAIFLCIRIFELDSLIEIWGLWAWILAFMWFTAPVWALDMIAGIIILQSKNFETGEIFYIYETDVYVWIKSISLTEVKCIDLRTWHPIIYRPSSFRNITLKNISQWISGKTQKIMRELTIKIDYKQDFEALKNLCYEAFDSMQVDLLTPEATNYFWEKPFRSLEIVKFWDYAVEYKFFYTIVSPFYLFKAERLLHEYLYKAQKEKNIYFSTPDLISIQKNNSMI